MKKKAVKKAPREIVDPLQSLYDGATSGARAGGFIGRAAIHRAAGRSFLVVLLPFPSFASDKDLETALGMVTGG